MKRRLSRHWSIRSHRGQLGWPAVDEEIRELRRRFEYAVTPQECKDVGLRCVTVTELLGDVVYDPIKHVTPGEEPASRGQTKIRFERYIEAQLPGRENGVNAGAPITASQGGR